MTAVLVKDLLGHQYHFARWAQADDVAYLPGIYIFVTQLPDGNLRPLYVGMSEQLRQRIVDRLPQHDHYRDLVQLGYTEILVWYAPLLCDLGAIEQRIIEALNPPLNNKPKDIVNALAFGLNAL
jgi:excinuclease UvrABC nuclease subunit